MERARFVAAELGLREKLIVIQLTQPQWALALNQYISPHVPKTLFFVDADKITAEMGKLMNVVPFPRRNDQHTHIPLLNGISNMVGKDDIGARINAGTRVFQPREGAYSNFKLLRCLICARILDSRRELRVVLSVV